MLRFLTGYTLTVQLKKLLSGEPLACLGVLVMSLEALAHVPARSFSKNTGCCLHRIFILFPVCSGVGTLQRHEGGGDSVTLKIPC